MIEWGIIRCWQGEDKMKSACGSNVLNITSCHWQLLKTHHLGNSRNEGNDRASKRQPLPRSRQRHSACRVGEFVYVFCGKDGTSPLKDIWKYHIYDQTWEIVELRGGSLPLLQGHTAVAYKRLIVIFGGTFNNNVTDIQMWMFNTDLGHLREVWAEPGAAQPLCRRDHSAVMHHNLMYMFGGFKDPTGASQELWAFNIEEEEWTELTHMSHSRPSGRYGHTAVVADNAMWIFGGSSGLTPCTDFWKYSFSLHQWTKLKCVAAPPSVSGHSACVLYQQMIVVGGNCKGKPVSDVWSYRFDTNSWQKLSSAGMPLPELSLHTCVSISTLDPWSQPPADRTLSTPHLKSPSSSLLHPDRFLVRPRTSPSVLEDRATCASHGDGVERCGVPSTRVMLMEELNSEAVDQRHSNTNSTNRVDPRIHVSLSEPLVPDSPAVTGFYDSCIPFSPRGTDHREEELQVLHSMPGTGGRDSDCSVLGATDHHPSHCSVLGATDHHPSQGSHRTVMDLMEHVDFPVLKASKNGYKSEALRKEITFWNDMFIEDLESSDEVGLSEVKIFYPTKHPVLLRSGPVVSDCEDGMETVPDMSPHQWRSDENSSGKQIGCIPHPPQHQDSPPIPRDTVTEHKQSEPGRVQHPTKRGSCQAQPPRLHSDNRGHQGLSQCWPSDAAVRVAASDQERNRLNLELDASLEEETSFIDGGDSARSRPVLCNSGKTLRPSSDHHCTPAVSGVSRPRGTTGGGVARCLEKRMKGGGGVKEEMMLEEPFVLVLGGKMEQQLGVHPKPITVWKGAFV